MASFPGPSQQLMEDATAAEAALPISSRPPLPAAALDNFSQSSSATFLDDEERDRGASGGNRWPRQETLALLKIRSDMDAAFRDAYVKAPLWEDVSRKLGELGYHRNAKKCKEKFENVHKYYKRTKEGRAGRHDGKNYRFFSQLEALHSATPAAAAPPTTTTAKTASTIIPPQAPAPVSTPVTGTGNPMIVSPLGTIQPPQVSAPAVAVPAPGGPVLTAEPTPGMPSSAGRISFSSNTSSATASSDTEENMEEEVVGEWGGGSGRKRKRARADRGRRRMMDFFEGLMKQMMERQEAMQRQFLEAIERREQDRMIRDETWRQQEMARLAREHEMLAQERATSASRDAAIVAFLQKFTGQTIQLPHVVTIPAPPQPKVVQPEPPPPPPPPLVPQPQPYQQQEKQKHFQQSPNTETLRQPPSSTEIVVVAQPEQQQPPQQQHDLSAGLETVSSSRWPKAEVLALIGLRSGMEPKYQEVGPKGPLWEDISTGMRGLGYNRSAKRCKEKWENINKYFKKVKERKKKRPEDAKTCPYFYQLDALYKQKAFGSGGGSCSRQDQSPKLNPNPHQGGDVLAIMPPPQPQQPQPEIKSSNALGDAEDGSSSQVKTSNGGGLAPSFFQEGPVKKPEDIVKELIEPKTVVIDYNKVEQVGNLNHEEDDEDEFDDDSGGDDDDDCEADMKTASYEIQFQSQNPNSSNGGNAHSSFAAMVQ